LRKQLSDLKDLARKNPTIQKKITEKEKEIDVFLKDKNPSLKEDLTYCLFNLGIKKVFNDNADIPLQKLEEEGTLFYLNNWDWFKSLTPENIAKEISLKFDPKSLSEKFSELMHLVVEDFIRSGETTFIDYYLNKEATFLEEKYPSDEDDFELRAYCAIYLYQNFCDDEDEDDVIFLPDGTKISIVNNREVISSNSDSKIYSVNFDMVYQMTVTLDYYIDDTSDEFYYPAHSKKLKFEHRLLAPFNGFVKGVSDEALSPLFLNQTYYISTSRVSVQRIYTYQSNEFSRLIEEYVENKRNKDYSLNFFYEYDSFINKWIKAFGIGESIVLTTDEEGIGTKIKVNKGDYTRLLADEGYGITQLVSILLQIEVRIQNSKFKPQHPANLNSDGEYRGSFCEDSIIIEEPEIHLHPKYQSLLADMFTDAYVNYNIHFIIETHSEYLIRRLQNIIGDTNSRLLPIDVSINYVYSKDDPDNDQANPIKRINLRNDGRLEDSFGKGFFDEADRQVAELVNRKVERHGRFSKK